ncbi:Alpha/Beta hydrolase protein [Crucibulum laeve]|uniref:Alpha/Beta hydrolase protein n=1 Tax=Crucibulum laeve TaxID=68775 RepID=A0A5C3MD48_9AGAR|nr:Alpha/Beta hydrolase protein [Crucibulum laeve]
MNSVYVPVHVVVLLKRFVNVVSTLSISNQYILYKHAKAEEARLGAETKPTPSRNPTLETLNGVKGGNWPWWLLRSNWDRIRLSNFDRSTTLEEIRESSGMLKAGSIALPWLGKVWSMFSSLQTAGGAPPHNDDPPPSAKRRNNKKSSKDPFKLPSDMKEPDPTPPDIIHQLLVNPALYDPLRTPRYPIVLCHGLYGFDSRGPSTFPSMRMNYWQNVLRVLRDKIGAEVIVTSVPGTGSIIERAQKLDQQLQTRARGRGVNFLAHSMGGLDCRHLITHIKPSEYAPLSLTTIGTPHRGSPFMDWCVDNIGIGKLRQQERDLANALNGDVASSVKETGSSSNNAKSKSEAAFSLSLASLPSSFTTLLLSIVDSPAYANLTTTYLNNVFNPATPDDPNVKYYSVAGRMPGVNIWHPFWLPKMVLDGVEEKERTKLKAAWEKEREAMGGTRNDGRPLWAQEREWGNDGLVTVQSSKWGEFLGILEGCDHWEMRGARGIEFGVDLPAIPAIGLGIASSSTPSVSETINGDGWGLNWGRFVGAWKKEETKQRDRNAIAADSEKVKPYQTPRERSEARESQRQRDRESDDQIIKSSTDKLSMVFDWLIEQIPAPQQLGEQGRIIVKNAAGTAKIAAATASKVSEVRREESEEVSEMKKRMDKEGLGRKTNELETKADLERFYVALSRKMWDEGL